MSRRPVIRLVAAFAGALVGLPALAQDFPGAGPIPPLDIPNAGFGAGGPSRALEVPGLTPPPLPPLGEPAAALPPTVDGLPGSVSTYAAPDALPDAMRDLSPDIAPILTPELVLTARLTEDGPPLRGGMVWRVFGENPGPDGHLPLVAQANGGKATIRLKPGTYLVHGGFGYAGRTDRVVVTGGIEETTLVLNAGGLALDAKAVEDLPLRTESLRFDIYAMESDERGERKAVATDVRAGEVVRLGADTYYVVSRYGSVNAQTHADVEVKAGKLTEVTLYQRAGEVTLKLVGAPGGEAIADTKWSVLTPGGDIVTEGVGAFPSFILAAGGYTVIARHDDQVFQREFDVESGRDAEVEVLARDPVAARAGK